MSTKKISYVNEAVFNQYNIIVFIGFLAFTLISGEYILMVLWLGLEMLYLAFIPGSNFFRQHVDKKIARVQQNEQARQRGQILINMTETYRKKFYNLKNLHDQILNSPTLKDEQLASLWKDQIDKLSSVLNSYLNMLYYLQNFETTFSEKKLNELKEECKKISKELKDEAHGSKLREIKEQRYEILQKRLEKMERAVDERKATEEQIKVIEETIQYIYEQITSIKDPRSVSEQLDTLLINAEVSESTMRDLMDASPDWSK